MRYSLVNEDRIETARMPKYIPKEPDTLPEIPKAKRRQSFTATIKAMIGLK